MQTFHTWSGPCCYWHLFSLVGTTTSQQENQEATCTNGLLTKVEWINFFQGTATTPPSCLWSVAASSSALGLMVCPSVLGFVMIREKPYPSDVPPASDSCTHITEEQGFSVHVSRVIRHHAVYNPLLQQSWKEPQRRQITYVPKTVIPKEKIVKIREGKIKMM